jgi:hypothetical protein
VGGMDSVASGQGPRVGFFEHSDKVASAFKAIN